MKNNVEQFSIPSINPTKREPELLSFYICTRDGTKLAADLYLPRYRLRDEVFPTVLEILHRPRGLSLKWLLWFYYLRIRRRTVDHKNIKKYIASGYAHLRVEMRGIGASFGNRGNTYLISHTDIDDAEDLINWICNQSWSDGSVGLVGRGKSGRLMEIILSKKIRAVKALALDCSVFDNYTDEFFPNGIRNYKLYDEYIGIFFNRFIDNKSSLISKLISYIISPCPIPVDGKNGKKLLKKAFLERVNNIKNLKNIINNITYRDDPMFSSLSSHLYIKEIESSNVPIYSFEGWYHEATVLSGLKRFMNVKTPGNKLLIGAWLNAGESRAFDPARNEIYNTSLDKDAEIIRFFDFYVKKKPDIPIEKEEPIRYQIVGNDNFWSTSKTWPPTGYKLFPFYLFENRLLSKNLQNKKYIEDTVPFKSKVKVNCFSRWSYRNKKKNIKFSFETKDGMLSYATPPFKGNFLITGLIYVTLYIRSNLEDVNLFVYLDEITEDGRSLYITEGLFKCSARKISENKALYKQLSLYHSFLREDEMFLDLNGHNNIRFTLCPICYVVKRGSSIKLTITCEDDNFPKKYHKKPEIQVCLGNEFPSNMSILGKENFESYTKPLKF